MIPTDKWWGHTLAQNHNFSEYKQQKLKSFLQGITMSRHNTWVWKNCLVERVSAAIHTEEFVPNYCSISTNFSAALVVILRSYPYQ